MFLVYIYIHFSNKRIKHTSWLPFFVKGSARNGMDYHGYRTVLCSDDDEAARLKRKNNRLDQP